MGNEWEAIRWKFTLKGDRIVAYCGHTHRSEEAARICASDHNRTDMQDGIWVSREVVYYHA